MDGYEGIPLEAFQHICRTCLTYTGLYPINKVQMEDGQLDNIMLSIDALLFEENSELPQNMCKNCIIKIYDVHRFVKNCQASQRFLKQKLSQKNKLNNSSISATVENEVIRSRNESESDDINDGIHQSIANENEYNSLDSASSEDETQDTGVEETVSTKNEKIDANELVEKIQQIKSEITTIKQTIPKKKVIPRTRRKVPADISSRVSTIRRVKLTGPPFNCSECSESFDIYMALRKHWQVYNHHPKNFKCIYCPVAFRSNCILQQHIRTHTGEKPNVCNICNKCFNHRSNYRRHMYTHSESKRYQCNECIQGFNRLEFLKDHQRKYHAGEKLLCPYCGKDFTCLGTLKIHEKQHVNYKTAVIIDSKIPYQCKTCGKILATEDILNEHMQVHKKKKSSKKTKKEGDSMYKERKDPVCEHCQNVFKNSYELRLHRLDSQCTQFVTRYNCPQCDKVCITYGALYAHLKLHKEASENNIYECETCHEQFYKERRYKDHVKRHTRERKFICADCGQGFYIRLHLENHMRTHTGERPFACDICHKAFALKVNLTVHMRIHNDVKPYKCCICSHEFRDVSSLRKHSKRYHNVDVTDVNESV